MTAVEWDEVKRLAADFQRAQLSSTVQRLSERNCVELVTKLIEQKLLDVIFTTDGKEYVTPQQLIREIRDELFVHGGRINLVELARILNVDLSYVSARVAELERKESGLTVVLGQLIDKTYINQIAVEINEKLSQEGQVTVGDLTTQFDLPSDFLQSIIEKHLGKVIHGRQDKTNHQVFYTDAFVARNKACLRGAFLAATRPTPIAQILAQSGVEERFFNSVIDSLVVAKQIPGVVSGKQSGSGIYIPTIYSKAQSDWVNSFYRQNGYLEYDALARLGISDPQKFVQKHFLSENLMLLKSCAVGQQLINQIEAAVEEEVAIGSFVDIMPHLPSVFEADDGGTILNEVLKTLKAKNPSVNVHVFCSTIVVSEQFIQKISKPFDLIIKKKAEEAVNSGAYLQAQADTKLHGGKNVDDHEEVSARDRKEERRKKASGGKGGGGTQGRETKTKSTKKKYMRGKGAADDSDEETSATSTGGKGSKQGGNKLELLRLSEVQEILEINDVFRGDEDLTELIEEIAQHIHPTLSKAALSTAQAVFESTMASTAQTRRKTHSELQEKLNAMIANVRLFEKGIKQFSNNDTQQQLMKYLLKSLCTEIANDVFLYVVQENMIQCDQSKELTPEGRTRILSEVPVEAKEPLTKLHKSLNGSSVDDFLSCVEVAMGTGVCDMIVRKPDKKKERPQVYAHRQALLEQLSVAQDPAVVLHVAALILFQTMTQTALHASGRFVSIILSYLQSHLPPDTFNKLQKYHDSVLKLLTTNEDDPSRGNIVTSLEDDMAAVKEIAMTFKRPSSSEKSSNAD